ncbi:D-xylose 1-dehydrogenase (NADP(+)) [Colletotrichum spaethianum]|uniref:D-xylose 1-dehydrogenase (NADP(+), D-xylono-1,5-lactone-forming) n=1 Tax=Colletotrichum spaethianum TaxID=700344 RepID=A0AA37P8G4_9PEZI|nr:D-xylose 1-dehydrogenase (NADP(+)) [Colletotrichum spaethianum]GKT47574.1 D-xylose 1-dehydrogenase (NADP(+)) [Colletotrichum spaethianum]
MTTDIPILRWGIIATGLISSWFVEDLVLERSDAKAKHIIQSIGSSSLQKGKAFVEKHLPGKEPTVYGSYAEVYNDPNVDVIYIGTPHAFHKQNCLDAIRAGKHVLCEKAFTITAKEAREVFNAAKEKGVFVMEAMWTRFFPLTQSLLEVLHSDKLIGDIHRVFCDFSTNMNIASLGPDSRLKNPALGAGSLLDIGVYSLTFTILALDPGVGDKAKKPKITATQTISDDIDIATSALLLYPSGKQGILTASTQVKSPPGFCRIEGSDGYIIVEGVATSVPGSFTVHSSTASGEGWAESPTLGLKSKKFDFERIGKGFYWEADAVALDVAAGRTESDVMPWAETTRVMDILDEIRRQGGAKFPQDDQ